MLCIDNRENELIKLLDGKTEYSVKQLHVADIWIGLSPDSELKPDETECRGLLIERKSIKDFEASILDGRYREQRGRLLAFCQEKNTQPAYILEGALSSGTGRLQKSALIKFMNRLSLHYQIPIFQTSSVHETSELVLALHEQWNETDSQKTIRKKTDQVKVTDGIHVQKKVNALEPQQFLIGCLTQCPGVSVKIAEAIIKEFNTLKSIMDTSSDNIANIKVGTRRIGQIVAKRLCDLLQN
jgi:ERCC4-type nuclease